MALEETSCCGVREFDGVRDYANRPEEAMDMIARARIVDDERFRFVIFTDVNSCTHIKAVERYVNKNKLGTFTKTALKKNPNTANKIRVYILDLNATKLRSWYTKRDPDWQINYTYRL